MIHRSANVFFKDSLAGRLLETGDGGTYFIYEQAWTEEIACCFPITRREYRWDQGLHPFFQQLGTEGWLREQQARIEHVAAEDDLGLLLRYGADCIGAISIQAAEKNASSAKVIESNVNPGRTISGVQKKLLIKKDESSGVFTPALASGAAPYIAKFNSESIPTLVHNEFLSLRWIKEVLGDHEVNEFCLSSISSLDEIALVVTRFDRSPHGEKFRQEDFAQILCKPKGLNYAGKYEAAYEDIALAISQYSARVTIDLSKFFRRLIAFSLIGNCDAHLKNFSLLETPEGLRLSPVYDVLNTAIYPGYNQELALTIGGKRITLDLINHDLLFKFGKEIGLAEKAIERAFVDIKRQVNKAASIISPLPAEDPASFRTRFEEIVRNACLRILK